MGRKNKKKAKKLKGVKIKLKSKKNEKKVVNTKKSTPS